MRTLTTSAKPRDVDNVLLRLPASVRQAAVDDAQASQLPQNTIYAAAVLQWTLARGLVPHIGHPQNLLNLFSEIDASLKDNFPVVGAFQTADWEDVAGFLERLSDGGIIAEFRSKVDAKSASTIVYAFVLTKVGRAVWEFMSSGLRAAIADRLQELLSSTSETAESP